MLRLVTTCFASLAVLFTISVQQVQGQLTATLTTQIIGNPPTQHQWKATGALSNSPNNVNCNFEIKLYQKRADLPEQLVQTVTQNTMGNGGNLPYDTGFINFAPTAGYDYYFKVRCSYGSTMPPTVVGPLQSNTVTY